MRLNEPFLTLILAFLQIERSSDMLLFSLTDKSTSCKLKMTTRCRQGENFMYELTLGEIEGRFADMIWENEPIKTNELLKLCEDAFGWKRSTTYTVLKRLEKKGLFTNQDGTVTSLISRDEFYSRQSEQYVEQSFGGSLPKFLAAFTCGKKFSDKEILELKKIIDEASE